MEFFFATQWDILKCASFHCFYCMDSEECWSSQTPFYSSTKMWIISHHRKRLRSKTILRSVKSNYSGHHILVAENQATKWSYTIEQHIRDTPVFQAQKLDSQGLDWAWTVTSVHKTGSYLALPLVTHDFSKPEED